MTARLASADRLGPDDAAALSAPERRGQPRGGAWRRVEPWIAAAVLFLITGPFQYQIKGVDPRAALVLNPQTMRDASAGSAVQIVMKAGLLLICALPLLLQPRQALAIAARLPFVLLFVVYAGLSLAWSDSPALSVQAIALLVTATLAGCAVVCRYDAEDAGRVFAYAGLLMVAASILTVVLQPQFGVHQAVDADQNGHAGAWRGVYVHKNLLGHIAAAYLVVTLCTGRPWFGARWRQALAAAALLLAVVASGSASGYVIIVGGLGAFALLFWLRGAVQLAALMLTPILGILVYSSAPLILALLGRDEHLSGRAEVWAACLRFILAKPLTGYGYGATTYGGLTEFIWKQYLAPHPHNAYLDLTLGGGVIGLALFAAMLVNGFWRSAAALRAGPQERAAARMLVVLIVCWLISGLSEPAFRPNVPLGAIGLAAVVVASCLGGRGRPPRPADDTFSAAI